MAGSGHQRCVGAWRGATLRFRPQSRHSPPMPRAVITVLSGASDDAGSEATFNAEWELVEQWLDRWRDNMATCPENFEGCGCCVVYWEVDAPQCALEELPSHLLTGTW